MSGRYISLSGALLMTVCQFSIGQYGNWDYPVKPGSEKWKNLETIEHKEAVCQLPAEVLKFSSTDSLLKLCLDYPLLANIMAFQTASDRLLYLSNTFNGVAELMKRDDLIPEIDMAISTLGSLISGRGLSNIESGKYTFQIRVLYLLRPETGLSKKNRELTSIIKGTPLKFTKLYNILTPSGSQVSAYSVSETTDAEREYFDDYYRSTYPNTTFIATYGEFSSTRRFNCHGYAWRMSEQRNPLENPVWIGLESNSDDDVYATDGSYIQVLNEMYPGKVTWDDASDHSAVTTSQPGIWISKWNEFPLVRHKWNDTPYRITSLKFYTGTAIAGSIANLCHGSERTFSVVDIPNAEYNWNLGPGLICLINEKNSVTVKPDESYTGLTHIDVTIKSPLGTDNYDIKTSPAKSFWIGEPIPPESIEELTDAICAHRMAEFTVVDNINSSNVVYIWEVSPHDQSAIFKPGHPYGKTNNGSNYMVSAHTGESATVFTGNDTDLSIRVRAANTCGLSAPLDLTLRVDDCREPSYIVIKGHPNPVTDQLQVSVDDSNLFEGDTVDEYIVVITDLLYRTLYQGRTEGKRMTWNTGNLPNGVYLITVKTAGGYFIEKFIKN